MEKVEKIKMAKLKNDLIALYQCGLRDYEANYQAICAAKGDLETAKIFLGYQNEPPAQTDTGRP